ncbi:Leucine Rich Repeat [Seminavis robusta]|uniref:Leucine Rich Repeat n=1 Tax=Seminavis robusta TaxID=568900 RepID=A0A9N8DKU3_9STRA|nr:Leucine Rich Repeat [Seminavis robusta]|eukprot:Sro199_g084530.1 Leucine Rich Repeat (602) ;mRNA; r:86394-88386
MKATETAANIVDESVSLEAAREAHVEHEIAEKTNDESAERTNTGHLEVGKAETETVSKMTGMEQHALQKMKNEASLSDFHLDGNKQENALEMMKKEEAMTLVPSTVSDGDARNHSAIDECFEESTDTSNNILPLPLTPGAPIMLASLPGAIPVTPGLSATRHNHQAEVDRQGIEPSQRDSVERDDEEQPAMQVIDGAVVVGDEENGGGVAHVAREHIPVQENEVIDGTILPESAPKPASNKRWAILIGTFAVAFCVVIILAIALSPRPEDDDADVQVPLETESLNEEMQLYPFFSEGLRTEVKAGIEIIGSPLYFANRWMLEDPLLETYPPEREMQRFNMAAFFLLTNGYNWTRRDGWLSYYIAECNWFSKSIERPCDDTGVLMNLNLSSNNLQRAYTDETIDFGTIRSFDLSYNNFTGPPPPLRAHNLEIFVVSHNKFTGQGRGSGILNSKLRVVKLDSNHFIRGNPNVFLLLPHLEVFNNSNNFKSNRENPYSGLVARCRNLTHLASANNNHYGMIPTELGSLSRLEELDLARNPHMSGLVPSELGLLTSLTKLDLGGTSVSGVLPEPLFQRQVLTVALGFGASIWTGNRAAPYGGVAN